MGMLYEVNLEIADAVAGECVVWLHDHVREIRALPGFTQAQVFDVLEPEAPEGWVGVCVQYRLADMTALHAYLQEYAGALRADGPRRFGEGMRVTRRVMQSVADY